MVREDFGGMDIFIRVYRRHPDKMIGRIALIGAWSGLAMFALPIALLIVFAVLTPETAYRISAIVLALALTWWSLRYVRTLLRVSS